LEASFTLFFSCLWLCLPRTIHIVFTRCEKMQKSSCEKMKKIVWNLKAHFHSGKFSAERNFFCKMWLADTNFPSEKTFEVENFQHLTMISSENFLSVEIFLEWKWAFIQGVLKICHSYMYQIFTQFIISACSSKFNLRDEFWHFRLYSKSSLILTQRVEVQSELLSSVSAVFE
jgi:hypothetical protein